MQNSSLRTGFSAHHPHTRTLTSLPLLLFNFQHHASLRSNGTIKPTLSLQTASFPPGSLQRSLSRSPTSSLSVEAKLDYSPSTKTGQTPRSGSSKGPENLRRLVFIQFLFLFLFLLGIRPYSKTSLSDLIPSSRVDILLFHVHFP